MTTLLTTMRQQLADAESDAERLRAAIQILEQAETAGQASTRRESRRSSAAAAVTRPRPARKGRESATTKGQAAPKGKAAAPKATARKATTEKSAPTATNGKSTATAAKPTAAAPAKAPAPAPAPAPAKAAAPKPAPAKRGPAAKRKPAKAVVPLEKLLKVVGDSPGLTTTALAAQTGGDQAALLELLKESEQKGEVRREGERRATSWFRITDEDRVAARAAEIAAQSKSATTTRKTAAQPAKK